MKHANPQPWIHSAGVDSTFILAPALLATAVALLFVASGRGTADVSLWAWALLVIGIDVHLEGRGRVPQGQGLPPGRLYDEVPRSPPAHQRDH